MTTMGPTTFNMTKDDPNLRRLRYTIQAIAASTCSVRRPRQVIDIDEAQGRPAWHCKSPICRQSVSAEISAAITRPEKWGRSAAAGHIQCCRLHLILPFGAAGGLNGSSGADRPPPPCSTLYSVFHLFRSTTHMQWSSRSRANLAEDVDRYVVKRYRT